VARRAGRLPFAGDITPDQLRPDPEDNDIAKLLAALPPGLRQAITLCFVDGMSIPEIAEALGIPESTEKSLLHQDVAKLMASPALKEFFN